MEISPNSSAAMTRYFDVAIAIRKPGYCRHFVSFLLLLSCTHFSIAALAQERQFGAWQVGTMTDNEGVYAATANESGGILGEYCLTADRNCYWLLMNDAGCDDGHRYPVLVNADGGSSSLEIYCMKLEGKPRYAFTSFDAIDRVIKSSKRLGIAFPMRDGYFSVSRFSLEGATVAISNMRSVGASRQRGPTGTRDTRL
jgi:hypothetical protein